MFSIDLFHHIPLAPTGICREYFEYIKSKILICIINDEETDYNTQL
jgi:hypothetical protein